MPAWGSHGWASSPRAITMQNGRHREAGALVSHLQQSEQRLGKHLWINSRGDKHQRLPCSLTSLPLNVSVTRTRAQMPPGGGQESALHQTLARWVDPEFLALSTPARHTCLPEVRRGWSRCWKGLTRDGWVNISGFSSSPRAQPPRVSTGP